MVGRGHPRSRTLQMNLLRSPMGTTLQVGLLGRVLTLLRVVYSCRTLSLTRPCPSNRLSGRPRTVPVMSPPSLFLRTVYVVIIVSLRLSVPPSLETNSIRVMRWYSLPLHLGDRGTMTQLPL